MKYQRAALEYLIGEGAIHAGLPEFSAVLPRCRTTPLVALKPPRVVSAIAEICVAFAYGVARGSTATRRDEVVWQLVKRLDGLSADQFCNFPIAFAARGAEVYLQQHRGETEPNYIAIAGETPRIIGEQASEVLCRLETEIGLGIEASQFLARFDAKSLCGTLPIWKDRARLTLPSAGTRRRLVKEAFTDAGFRFTAQGAVATLSDGRSIEADFDFNGRAAQIIYSCYVVEQGARIFGPFSLESWLGLKAGAGEIDGIHAENTAASADTLRRLSSRLLRIASLV